MLFGTDWTKVGAIGEWVGGIAAAIALAVTGWALVQETRDRKAEAADRRDAHMRQLRLDEEARTLTALSLAFEFGQNRGRTDRVTAAAVNKSTTYRFFDVTVVQVHDGTTTSLRRWPRIDPGDRRSEAISLRVPAEPADVRLQYTDHVNVHWEQTPDGRVRRLDKPPSIDIS